MKTKILADFQLYISVEESEALHKVQSKDAAWFIDGMALVRCSKPK